MYMFFLCVVLVYVGLVRQQMQAIFLFHRGFVQNLPNTVTHRNYFLQLIFCQTSWKIHLFFISIEALVCCKNQNYYHLACGPDFMLAISPVIILCCTVIYVYNCWW